jgi:16S rRNA processing protein RimM
MQIEGCYKIGIIAKPHGLKGSMTVLFDQDIPNDLSAIDSVFVLQGNSLVPHFLKDISVKGNKAYVMFEDIDSLEKAEVISKCLLYLPKSTRPKSGKNDFYEDEIIDFKVIDIHSGGLGSVTGVVKSGLQSLLSVTNGDKEHLIPINDVFIVKVDKKKSIIEVNLPDGFLDL